MILGAVAFLLILTMCYNVSPYEKMETKELTNAERHDSLFFGLYLGMSSKDFYTHCWNLNKKGLIRQGAANTSVYYEVKDFQYPAGMDFYPRFHDDKIIEMPILFSYTAWAPWNKHLFADQLKTEVLQLMEKWYGSGFIEIPSPTPLRGSAFTKIDGNRRITVYDIDDQQVRVDIVDLRKIKELEATNDSVPAR